MLMSPVFGQADDFGPPEAVLLVGLIFIGLYIYAIVVCFQKGKTTFGWLGIAGLLLPILDWFAIVGAIRLAKPDSRWAVERYGPNKVALAQLRFGHPADASTAYQPRPEHRTLASPAERSRDRRAGVRPPPPLPRQASRARKSPAEATRDRRESTSRPPGTYRVPPGGVLIYEVPGPPSETKERGQVPPGSIVQLEQVAGNWGLIAPREGVRGWMSDVGRLLPAEWQGPRGERLVVDEPRDRLSDSRTEPRRASRPRTAAQEPRAPTPEVPGQSRSGDIIFCPACGTKVFEDAAFCHRCGRRLAE